MDALKNGTFPKLPFEIKKGNVAKEFEKLHVDGKSLLTTKSKFIEFRGLQELLDRSCDHVELSNPTDKTILFNIREPESPAFFVKPHVGLVEPHKSVKLYFTFKGKKCGRLPADYCWIYAIYHITINQKDTDFIKEDEFSSGNLRNVWIEKGSGDIDHILYLSSLFPKDKKPEFECKGHRQYLDRGLHLNNQGEVEQVINEVSKGEASDTPSRAVKNSRGLRKTMSSSDTTDELPKTAEN